MLGGFLQRQRHQHLARRQGRQQGLFLGFGTQFVNRGGAHQHRCLQRAGAQMAPRLLQHQAETRITIAEAAIRFGNRDAGPAHGCNFLPHLAIEAQFVIRITQGAQLGHTGLCCQ